MRNLKFVQSAYQKDSLVQIVSFFVTPDLDTPEELQKLADQKGIYNGNKGESVEILMKDIEILK